MHTYRTAHYQRLQYMPLDLLHGDDHSEHEEGCKRVEVDEGDENGKYAGEDGTNDGNERTEEDGDSDRNDQRESPIEEAYHPGTQADADGVDKGHEDLHPNEVGERHPAGATRVVDGDACLPWEETNHPAPNTRAIDEQEERRKEGKQDAGEKASCGRSERERSGDQRLAVILDGGPSLVEVAVDVALGEMQRRCEQETLEVVKGDNALLLQIRKSDPHLNDDEHDQTGHDREQTNLGERD